MLLQNSDHPITQQLVSLMQAKQSNLSISADVTTADALLGLVKATADTMVVLKTHMDIVRDFTPQLTQELRALADAHGFLIFEDRKFADIGNTVKYQVEQGVYQISSWADIINAHLLPGIGIIDGLKAGCQSREVGLLLLAQMSSANNLFTHQYTEITAQVAKQRKDFVMGFIAQSRVSQDTDLVTMTPGVNLSVGGDVLGQNYNDPMHAVANGADIIIVGRGIYGAKNPSEVAKEYQRLGWEALQSR